MEERKGENTRSLGVFFFPCHSDKKFAFLEEMCLLPPLGDCTRLLFVFGSGFFFYFLNLFILPPPPLLLSDPTDVNQHRNRKSPNRSEPTLEAKERVMEGEGESSSLPPSPCSALSEGRSTALICTRDSS